MAIRRTGFYVDSYSDPYTHSYSDGIYNFTFDINFHPDRYSHNNAGKGWTIIARRTSIAVHADADADTFNYLPRFNSNTYTNVNGHKGYTTSFDCRAERTTTDLNP